MDTCVQHQQRPLITSAEGESAAKGGVLEG